MIEPQSAIATARVRWRRQRYRGEHRNEIPVRLRVGEVILGVAEDHVLEKEEYSSSFSRAVMYGL